MIILLELVKLMIISDEFSTLLQPFTKKMACLNTGWGCSLINQQAALGNCIIVVEASTTSYPWNMFVSSCWVVFHGSACDAALKAHVETWFNWNIKNKTQCSKTSKQSSAHIINELVNDSINKNKNPPLMLEYDKHITMKRVSWRQLTCVDQESCRGHRTRSTVQKLFHECFSFPVGAFNEPVQHNGTGEFEFR